MSTQHLYRHFDGDGKLLYVGISLSAINRLGQHKDASHWFNDIAEVKIENYDDRASVIAAEREAITKENPLHNKMRPSTVAPTRLERAIVQSRERLVNNVAGFRVMYSVGDVSIQTGIALAKVKALIANDTLGHIVIGIRNTVAGERPVIRVTGWQLIDFIEQLQEKKIKV